MSKAEIDAEYQSRITCPHCGHKATNSWESGLGDGDQEDMQCDKCEKAFQVTASVERLFSSEIIPNTELIK